MIDGDRRIVQIMLRAIMSVSVPAVLFVELILDDKRIRKTTTFSMLSSLSNAKVKGKKKCFFLPFF